MNKYTYEQIKFVRHLWIQNYTELGLAKKISEALSSNYLLTIVSIFAWLVVAPKYTDNVLIIISPFLIAGLSLFLILLYGVYTSMKVLNVLELCRKYIDREMSLDDLFEIINTK